MGNFTDIFIRRPVLALVVNLLILIAGLQALRTLSVHQYPKSDIAVLKITTNYIGANADLVLGFITTPLERVISSMEGIDYIESSSTQGSSTITVHLKLNYDTNAALSQVQAKVAQVRNHLPPEAEEPEIEVELADDQLAAAYLGFSSPDLDENQITDFLSRLVQPKLSNLSGVQRAEILGDRTFAMRIWLNPEKMAALNISSSEVRAALKANNYLSALGQTKGSMVTIRLMANTDLKTTEEFKSLVVKQSQGTVVRLGDIAEVALGAENDQELVRYNAKTAIFVGIWVLPSANSLEVIQQVKAILPEIDALLPANMKVGIAYDETLYIQSAIHDVSKTLVETLLIVTAVIFLFLGSVRSLLIPVIAIPISLIGACFLILIAGFTLNLLTLLAIVLAVGLVVDDAIVMVENVERHLYAGEKPLDAALLAARELAGPIIAMTITLAAVYAPIGLQGGLTGALFREFAFTLAGAVIVSGIVALTLSPMMCCKLLKPHKVESRFSRGIHHVFEKLQKYYVDILTKTLNYRPVIMTLAGIIIALIFPFYLFSVKELAPQEDKGVVFGVVQSAADATLDQSQLFAEKIYSVFKSIPEAQGIFEIINPLQGFGGMILTPWSHRTRTAAQLQFLIAPLLNQIPGVRVLPILPASLPGGGQFPVDFVISATADSSELFQVGQKVLDQALKSGFFIFADLDLKYDQPLAEVVFDRDQVRSQGVDLAQVGADLSTFLSGNYVNFFNIQGRSYKVIPQLSRRYRLNVDQLKDLYVTGAEGKLVPLATFAQIHLKTQPRALKRFQQLNAVRIQGLLRPDISLDQALKQLEKIAKQLLPRGFTIDYAGESRQLRVEGNRFLTIFLFSAILIYLVLAAQFESFWDPLIILLGSAPLALSGALLFTFLGCTSLNIYSQVGLITLIGLVSKNGILIVSFANELQAQGKSKLQAVIHAAGTRLRPILMTTAATVVGHVPLILAKGPGAGARNSIGIVLCTGMIIGTLFTLFILPTLYMVIAKRQTLKELTQREE